MKTAPGVVAEVKNTGCPKRSFLFFISLGIAVRLDLISKQKINNVSFNLI